MNGADLIAHILNLEGVKILPAFPHSDLIEAADKFEIHKLGGNYADVAVTLGGYGEQVTEPVNLKGTLRRALAENAEGIPALIEVISAEESRKAVTSHSDY
jgi:thiamine pyrophosphate-dependent acetolactate synthase large subunit-like protein